jgi:hypothetical protein
VQIGDNHRELRRISCNRRDGRPPVVGGGDLEALAAAEFGKQFPRTDDVVYNERFLLGSCTDGI